MDDRMDRLLRRIAAAQTDRDLSNFDESLERALSIRTQDRRTAVALGPIGLAALVLSLAVGVTAGGVTTVSAMSAPKPFNSFAVDAHLAPSTILEGQP